MSQVLVSLGSDFWNLMRPTRRASRRRSVTGLDRFCRTGIDRDSTYQQGEGGQSAPRDNDAAAVWNRASSCTTVT
ncbi:hypothetical protein E4U54_005624, partial [Claviceps lovelessii]